MTSNNEARLPYWPAALNHKMAAAYCGVSFETFKNICPVMPMQFTASNRGHRYLRQRLDEWLLSIDPNGPPAPAPFGEKLYGDTTKGGSKGGTFGTTNGQSDSGSQARTGLGGYPLVEDATAALRRWYGRLGFNPATMGVQEMERLQQEADAKWKASIPGSPLTKRERMALEQLAAHGAGQKIRSQKIKHCGSDTEERLKERGFLEASGNNKFPDRSIYYTLTDNGLEAWKALEGEDRDRI